MCCLWLSSCYNAELESCYRDWVAHKVKNVYYVVLYKNHLPTSGWKACKMWKDFRILALGRASTAVYQPVHLPKRGLPLNACYLECHLWYRARREEGIKQRQVQGGSQDCRCFVLMTIITMCSSYLLLCFTPPQSLLKANISLHRLLPCRLQLGSSPLLPSGHSRDLPSSGGWAPAGKPRWLHSHIGHFTWKATKCVSCPGISFSPQGPSSKTAGHLSMMTPGTTELK